MKPIKIFLFIAAVTLAFSCSSEEKKELAGVKVSRSVVKNCAEEKCTAKIALDGMSCGQMCPKAINGCLAKIEGIKTSNVYFDPERKKDDFATIVYDEKKVTEKELIAAIEKLNDGQYKVKSVEIVVSEVSYEKLEDPKEKKEEIKAGSGKVATISNIVMAVPSVLAIVKRLIH